MTILREHTNLKHREVEATPFVQYLLSGNITKEHYVAFLYEFRSIYEVIERENTKHGLLKGLEGIERAEAISSDLYELSQSHFHTLMPSTIEYTNHILQLSKSKSTLPNLSLIVLYTPISKLFLANFIHFSLPISSNSG